MEIKKGKEEHSEMKSCESVADQELLERAKQLIKAKERRGLPLKIIMGVVSVLFFLCLLYATLRIVTSVDVYTENGVHKQALDETYIIVLLIVGASGLVLMGLIQLLWSIFGSSIKPQNEVREEGIISKVEQIGTSRINDRMSTSIFLLSIAIPAEGLILTARAKVNYSVTTPIGREYKVGEKVSVKYDKTNHKKCFILD